MNPFELDNPVTPPIFAGRHEGYVMGSSLPMTQLNFKMSHGQT